MRRSAWGALVFLLAAPLGAQTGLTGAAIEGTVRGGGAAAVAGATVEVTDEANGVRRTTTTDTEGRYVVQALPPGTYALRVTCDGHRPLDRSALVAELGEVLVVDVTLALAFSESASVEQEGEAGGLAAAAVSAVVSARSIEALPTNGRDYVGFALLTPAVVAERTPPTGPTMSSGLSFAGQRARSNHVMVDGFDNDDVFTGAVAASFSQDAVREFQVLAVSAPVEFAQASAGIVNTVTRTGGNRLRGSAYLFLRDDRLNAKEHFEKYDVFGSPTSAPKAPFHQKQWGATLGGPLRADRTFFFLSYEKLATDAHNFVTIDPAVAAALEREGFEVALGSVPWAVRTDSALAKLEHVLTPRSRLMLRGHFSRRLNENAEPFGGIVARSRGAAQHRDDWGVALASTHVFGSGWLSEARLQVVEGDQVIESLDPRCGGPCSEVDQGGPEVTLSGLAVVGRQLNAPQARRNLSLQLAETLTRSVGRHTLKAGVELERVRREGLFAQDFGGRYVFTALPAQPGLASGPLTALEAFEAGLPALYVQGYGAPEGSGSSSRLALFAQDQWRVTSRLDVVAGLRYQRYDLGLPAQQVSDLGGTSLAYDVPARGSLAPRLSVSFDPFGRDRTLVRAAFGVFREDPLLAIAYVSDIVNGEALRLVSAGLPLSAAAWRSPDHRLPEPQAPFPSVVQLANPGLRAPRSLQLSLGLTQQLGRDLTATADFIAISSDGQIGVVDYNPVLPALGPGRRPNDADGRAGTSASVNHFTNYGESSYRGLALTLRKRMSRRFEAFLSYTWSRVTDAGSDMFGQVNVAEDSGEGRDASSPEGLPLGFDPEAFRGPSAVDQRHRLVFSGVAELPLRLTLSGIVTLGSGRPYTALSGVDSNGNGVPGNDRARRDPLDPASRVGRNAERMSGFATVDARLSHRVSLPRGAQLELLAEGFNLLNRVNYSEVNNVFGPGAFPDAPQRDSEGRVTYGLYTKAYPARQVQLAARLAF